MKELTIIIPLKEFNNKVKEELTRSVESVTSANVKPDTLVFAIPQSLEDEFVEYFTNTSEQLKKLGVDKVFCNLTEDDNFAKQVNQVANEVNTKYLSVLEVGDFYGTTWLENVEKHIVLNDEISLFLPIAKIYTEEGDFIRFYNEQYWAQGFTSQDLGFVDEAALKVLFDMNITGGVIKTEDFLEVGGLKPSLKQYFWYEFMLRFTNQTKTVYVIPKSLYNHVLHKVEMEEEEAKFYYDLCAKEYWYKEDRNKVYVKK